MTLLPPERFRRLVLPVAGLLAVLLLVDLLMVSNPARSQLFSNAMDLGMVLLAALCSVYVARKSSGYARQLWTLLSIALALESIAQAITTYYQAFVPDYTRIPLPSDILFFVWATPVFMMFLPRSDEKTASWDWLRILDFAQIAIVAATAYVYFFYVPSRWETRGMDLPRQILIVYLVRDALLAAGFFFRSKTSSAAGVRTFSVGLFLVFAAAAITDGDYLLTLKNFTGGASWGDFLYLIPYFLVIFLAVRWKYGEGENTIEAPSRIGDLTASHILPLCIPLLVIFMGRSIAKDEAVIAWLAVSASFLCAALRLILTNTKQKRVSSELLNTEKALRDSEYMFVSAFRSSPDAFIIAEFPEGVYLDVNESFTRLSGYSREEALGKTALQLNLWISPAHRTKVLEQIVRGTEIHNEEIEFRTKRGDIRSGLLSGALLDLNGRRCLLLAVRDSTEEKRAMEALRESEQRFRTLVRDLHVGVVLHGIDGRIEFANQAALEMFGLRANEVLGQAVSQLGRIPIDEQGREIAFEDLPVATVLKRRSAVRQGTMGWRRVDSQEILWIFGNAVPQFSSDGSILRVISSFTNITQLKHAEKAIHQLTTQLLKLQDEERRRIGRELHDGMAQTVLAVNLSLAQVRQSAPFLTEPAARALEKARELLQQMSREIRTLSYLLHPPLLDDLGLASALKDYIRGFGERSGIETIVELPAGFRRLPQAVETAFFRIVQESLANIQKHSGSKVARVELREEESSVWLEITDYGRGMISEFESNGARGETLLGVGIPGMRERITQIGGQFKIHSGPSGTTVRATISTIAPVLQEFLDGASTYPNRG